MDFFSLQENELHFDKKIFDSSSSCLLLNKRLELIAINEAGEKLLCCPSSLLCGHYIADIFKLHRATFPFTSEDLQSSHDDSKEFISSFKQHNVSDKTINWAIKKIKNNKDHQYFYVLIGNNIENNNQSSSNFFSNAVIECVNQTIQGVPDSSNLLFMLNSIIQSLPGCAHIKDSNNFRYLHTNQATLELLGMTTTHELINKDDYDLAKHMKWKWPGTFAQELQDYDASVINNRKPIVGLEEKPYLNAKGLLVTNSLTKIPVFATDGEPIGVLTYAIDISYLKNSIELRALYKNLYQNMKQAHEKFLQHIGLNKHLQEGNTITEKELDCLIAYCRGKTAKQAARLYNMSPRTFEKRLELIKFKFGCHERSELIDIFLSIFK